MLDLTPVVAHHQVHRALLAHQVHPALQVHQVHQALQVHQAPHHHRAHHHQAHHQAAVQARRRHQAAQVHLQAVPAQAGMFTFGKINIFIFHPKSQKNYK